MVQAPPHHSYAPRVGAVIRVMLDVAAAEVHFQPEPARTRSDDTPDPWVGSGSHPPSPSKFTPFCLKGLVQYMSLSTDPMALLCKRHV